MRANRKKCNKIFFPSTHMRGTGIDLEVEIYATKLDKPMNTNAWN
jgi:hypothetical protein